MKLHYFGKTCLLIFVYVFVIIWTSVRIWGSPKSTYEKRIQRISECYEERMDGNNIKYSVETEYITTSRHMLFQITGFEAEIIEGLAEFTLDSIILEKENERYSVDVIQEKLDHAARYAECEVKSDKIAYKAIIPADVLTSGKYKIGLLLEDNTVIWSSECLVAHPYFQVIGDSNDETIYNELNVLCDTLWVNRELDCLEGVGTNEETKINIINKNGSEFVELSFHIECEQENTYFLFFCNNVTVAHDMQQGENIELNFPLEDGENIIYIYYLSEDDKINTEEMSYYISDINVDFGDDVW